MSYRNEDQSFIDLIRSMKRRLDTMERAISSAKVNDIRLGDIVLSTDTETGRIIMRNLLNDTETYIGDPEDASWSFSGLMSTVAVGDECSPPHIMRATTTVRQIVLAQREAPAADLTVVIHLNDDAFSITARLPAEETTWITPVRIPVTINTASWVCLDTYGVSDRDLSVYLRFGQSTNTDTNLSET